MSRTGSNSRNYRLMRRFGVMLFPTSKDHGPKAGLYPQGCRSDSPAPVGVISSTQLNTVFKSDKPPESHSPENLQEIGGNVCRFFIGMRNSQEQRFPLRPRLEPNEKKNPCHKWLQGSASNWWFQTSLMLRLKDYLPDPMAPELFGICEAFCTFGKSVNT